MHVPQHRSARVRTSRTRAASISSATFGVVAVGAGALSMSPADASPVIAVTPESFDVPTSAVASAVPGLTEFDGVVDLDAYAGRHTYRVASSKAGSSTKAAVGAVAGSAGKMSVRAAVVTRKAISAAASRKGRPYRHGAAGPRAFDCSGLTQWSFKQAGITLPRTVKAQYRATEHVSKSAKRPGDLIFYYKGGRVYHVGIYAGNNKVWVARHTGTRITLQKIYSRSYYVGRVV